MSQSAANGPKKIRIASQHLRAGQPIRRVAEALELSPAAVRAAVGDLRSPALRLSVLVGTHELLDDLLTLRIASGLIDRSAAEFQRSVYLDLIDELKAATRRRRPRVKPLPRLQMSLFDDKPISTLEVELADLRREVRSLHSDAVKAASRGKFDAAKSIEQQIEQKKQRILDLEERLGADHLQETPTHG